MRKSLLIALLSLILLLPVFAFAAADPFDLNADGTPDTLESSVTVAVNATLPPGEYFFNDLIIGDGVTLTLQGDPAKDGFKGVHIHAVNLIVASTSFLSADMQGYDSAGGPGSPKDPQDFTVGGNYGGPAIPAVASYGSAIAPTDLGSAGGNCCNARAGGAIRLDVSGTLKNDGVISANGASASSGGSIYVTAGALSGDGVFRANGGGLGSIAAYFVSPGSGGRVAIHYSSSVFAGTLEANGGCGSYDGFSMSCASPGTGAFFDDAANDILIPKSFRFREADMPLSFGRIVLSDGASAAVEGGTTLVAAHLVLAHASFDVASSTLLHIPDISLENASTLVSRSGTLTADSIALQSGSAITTVPMSVLSIAADTVAVSADSMISVNGKGYGHNEGPGAFPFDPNSNILPGASYGGVGWQNTATSTYGDARAPADFGSGGPGYNPHGGGAMRLSIAGTLANDGVISANGDNTSSGGSLFITVNSLIGSGSFSANGGSNYCPNICMGPGGGGRIAIYYSATAFTGPIDASEGLYCYSGCVHGQAGPGTVVYEAAEPTCTADCNSNVLFIPGIEASRLYETRPDGSEDQLWEPNIDTDVQALYLNPDGSSVNPDIYTKDIIGETYLGSNIYKSFESTMDGLVSSGKIAKWTAFAYDWRMSPDDVVNVPQKYPSGQTISLTDTLKSLVASSTNGKVTIIAHSNGGLVAKSLIKKLEDDKAAGRNDLIDHIDVVILVASPQWGTPMAIPVLLHGFDQSHGFGAVTSDATARSLAVNMPDAYDLLPSQMYFNHVSTPVVNFVPNQNDPYISKEISLYSHVISTYAGEKVFITGTDGRKNPDPSDTLLPIKANTSLLSKAESFHSISDNLTIPSSIRIIQIAGWGEDTVAGFQYITDTTCAQKTDPGCTGKYTLDEQPIFTIDGDKTVVTPSALGMNGEKYYVDFYSYNTFLKINRQHKDILEIPSLLTFVSNTISNIPITNLPYISTSTPTYSGNKLRLSVHSPVTLDAYDQYGNHTGVVCPSSGDPCYIEENIPNSSYMEFGEGKYLNVPEDNVKSVKLYGTDVGTFTFESERVLPNGKTATTTFADIPVTPETIVDITPNLSTGVPTLKVDADGDGTDDFTVKPQATCDPSLYFQIIRKFGDSLNLPKNKKGDFDKKIDNILALIQKGKIDKISDKLKNFNGTFKQKLSKPHSRHIGAGKFSSNDSQSYLDTFNQMLDNFR
jgi:adhesin HecA-like repeat protein